MYACVCELSVCVYVCVHVCAEDRGERQVSSLIVPPKLLRQGLTEAGAHRFG